MLAPAEAFYEMQEEVRLEASTDELMAEYETTQNEIEQFKESVPKADQYTLRQQNLEHFARNDALASELRQREAVEREIRDTWIFSNAGLVLIALGFLAYTRNYQWVGMSLILPGFLELLWRSAPSFTLGGAVREYDILLINKIIMTIVSIVLLYTRWFIGQRKSARQAEGH